MEMRRTVPVKLDVGSDEAALLRETVDEFLWAANYVVDHAWRGEYKTTSKAQLQEETYDDVREQTRLHANLVQNARNKAADAVQGVLARWKQGEYASKPHFSNPTVVYDKRCATFHDDHVSLATIDGRLDVEYVLPDEDRDTPHSRYLDNDDYELTGAELHNKDGDWFLHLRTKAEMESDIPEQATIGHSTVLGVDLGVNQLAVTSTGTFWSGHKFDHWRREYEKRRASLQRCGSRHAHENIQAVGRKETGRYKTILHRIANGIIEEATENGCTIIAFEELTGIRDRLSGASWGHKWAFGRLCEYVEYKAEMHGIDVEQVDPENTSRCCSHCGFTHPDNRDGEDFACLNCGYENHADYNAAKNIGLRYLRRNQTGDGGGAPVGVRLNRGILNAKGGYEPSAGDSGQSGSPRESPTRNKANGEAVSE
ncbi:RNA-guided endonuclease InsQ/TnpB family protein [Halobellus clavatus]|uniref:Transposase, IS605 OrfB family, central region n=1 Tax=Halobellus clavatus TaxID=660517 RepID=A0A1H3FNE0_9EURY|nr:RNA-guided endonuclease TnpB family protein [Halobellus clavatus]SDX92317.1 transposase, IS605 OrfB family, central region [Halobellus clavatus]